MRRALTFVLAIPVGLLVSGCARAPARSRVLVLGFDGMDPRAIELLASEGKLPNFTRLKREGAYAPLASAKPLLSPVVWTTIATGKTPDRHGITHFTALEPSTGDAVGPCSRRGCAIPSLLLNTRLTPAT